MGPVPWALSPETIGALDLCPIQRIVKWWAQMVGLLGEADYRPASDRRAQVPALRSAAFGHGGNYSANRSNVTMCQAVHPGGLRKSRRIAYVWFHVEHERDAVARGGWREAGMLNGVGLEPCIREADSCLAKRASSIERFNRRGGCASRNESGNHVDNARRQRAGNGERLGGRRWRSGCACAIG
jgi:hypothetical protein